MATKEQPNQQAGLRTGANPERARAAHELRRSNAAQPHVPEPRKGTRQTRKLRAVDEQIKE